ncbi:hypothetical protein HF086_004162 [Spodoptera exigua]|uniref:Uncharacterized protein n=1 Tax=Spodoptera exigua TaxID=7107 RepID=A0A922MET4_SPOEX|nr:hypothetical protein HF086_004162 [Spodoptera exigua]
MRAELVQARAASAGGCQESGDAAGNVTDAARARSEAAQLARENAALRETVLALHSELFGARLATKYLDKELAGRIQQLQLLGRDMRAELRDSLWAQACHKEAVQALQSVKGDCALCVQFIATDDDDRLSEDNYRFPLYPEDGEVFGGEQDGSGATPTAPRTPDYNRRTSDAGSGSECESEPYRVAPPPPANYPDYNNINNNLNILDMDDDSIKIEARLEDWRTKGAYRPVELEAPSSDEPLTEAPCDNLPVSDGVPESPIAPAPPPQIVQPLIDIEPKDTKPSKPNGDVKPLRRESKGFR